MAEATEPTMDCNLPELLAQDLEFSSLIFAAKNMTAGAPSPTLASDEDDWHGGAEPPTVLGAPCHPNSVPQFQPLGAIDEKSSASGASEHDMSDDASSSSGDSFSMAGNDVDGEDDAAESPHIRQHSVLTADTVLTVSSQPAPTASSQKRVVSFGGDVEGSLKSWMDFEPEAPVDHPELGKSLAQSPVTTPLKPVRPLSRLGDRSINEPSPQRARSANAAVTSRRLSNPFEGYTRPTSRARSLQMDPTTPTAAGKAPSIISDLKEELEPWFRYLDADDDSVSPPRGLAPPLLVTPRSGSRSGVSRAATTPTPRPRSQTQTRPRPTSSVSTSYTWLEDPIDIPPPPSDDQSRRIPLPPNVMESIRVSVTCFPETMLLCSSLSIETIRSYSRKVRQPPLESLQPDTPPTSPKRWRWLSSRKTSNHGNGGGNIGGGNSSNNNYNNYSYSNSNNNSANRRCCSRSSSNVDLPFTINPSTTTLAPPQWSRIRSIFPHGSDYLCDALYAHIIVYNYLAPMVQNLRHGAAARPPTPGSPASTEEPIPRKAATLLGLQGGRSDATTPPPPPRPLRKRSSMFLGLRAATRQSTYPAPPMPPLPPLPSLPHAATTTTSAPLASDVSLRELQLGLHRCISRLVTTLRAEGTEGPVATGEPAGEVDPLVLRSLCEIVRCCEEAPTNDRSM
ncbi:hypothetical protein LZ30DRAFT_629632 [Colletotrichum cereale]|nr:hypothetical protein LZ30DRAFT_629632 [Colletotrichum cereale]